MIDIESERNRTQQKTKEHFDRWLSTPATRLMLSMIPAAEKPEVLETLLRECFNQGYAVGGVDFALTALTAMSKDRPAR